MAVGSAECGSKPGEVVAAAELMTLHSNNGAGVVCVCTLGCVCMGLFGSTSSLSYQQQQTTHRALQGHENAFRARQLQ